MGSRAMGRRAFRVLPGLVDLVADGDQPAVDGEALALEVDVVPLESEDLVASHAGHCREPEEREEAVAVRSPQDFLQLLLSPRAGFGSSGRLDQW